MALSKIHVVVAVAFFAITTTGFAQTEQPLEWLREMKALDGSHPEDQDRLQAQLDAMRRKVQDWILLHPSAVIALPPAPAGRWSADQLRGQLSLLKQTVEQVLQTDLGEVFTAGVIIVNVTATAKALSPVSESIGQQEIGNRDALTVREAIEYLPGVSIDYRAPRNQAGISAGGFDTRQVPLYLDGAPVYTPFDGYVDLSRYFTSDIAEIQVARGYSSPLLGPNLLGGVINLVTQVPNRRLDIHAFTGSGSGQLLNTGVHAGSRWSQFYLQGSVDRLQNHYYPLAAGFRLAGDQKNDRRVNSYHRDERFQGRVAWTPTGLDSYVFSYSDQKGRTGDPPYSGSAPQCPQGNATIAFPCVTPKYWKWPYWDAASYYFNSNTQVGNKSSLQFRLFASQYPSSLEMYDDATYATMSRNSNSGILKYSDRSTGASGAFETRLLYRHAIAASFFVKRDGHQEQTITFSSSNVPTTTPRQTDRDEQTSLGFQDIVTLSARLRASLGLSVEHLNGLEAQDLNATRTQVVPFQLGGVCGGLSDTSYHSCTTHTTVYNPVGSVSYADGDSGTVFVSFARKSRFPTLKDRYSYKAGRALPNPALRPERANNWSAGYSRTFRWRTVAQIEYFRNEVRDAIGNTFFASSLCSGAGRNAGCQQATNLEREVYQGANLTVQITPLSRLTVDANYGYLNRESFGTPGVLTSRAPKHKAVGTAAVRLPYSVLGIVSVKYLSAIVGTSDNGFPLPPSKFATVDLGARVPIRAGVKIKAGLKNLLDRNYYYWEGFPEGGRNWYATVTYDF